jgi:Domain of unknown function (DUF1772)
MASSIVRFFNILIAAILAGTSFGIWMGFNPQGYSYSTYVEQQQNLVSSLNTLMVALVILATIITLVSAFFQKENRLNFIALLIAAAMFASCILISRFGNLPIQNEIMEWKADSPTSNWTVLRDDWWAYHIKRTIVELIALMLVAWTSVRQKVG